MKAIVNATILAGGVFHTGQALLFTDHIIGLTDAPPAGAQIIDAQGGIVAAGLIDVHIHGFGGREAGDVGPQELLLMSRELVRYGVTAWLPTVSCLAWERYAQVFADIGAARDASFAPGFAGARILGAHAEGPFLSREKSGAQDPAHILPPDWAGMAPLLGAVRLMTVAPEGEGAPELIRNLVGAGVTVSIGHTNANYEQAMAGIEAGATHATHTFNAMPSLLHRQPGALGALLSDGRVFCELIADGFHVHPSLIALAAGLKGEKLVLVSDSIRFSGLPEGEHTIAGQTVTVKGIECRLPDGTIAGSTLTMDRAVRNAHTLGGLSLERALTAAAKAPATSIGETERGDLLPGFAADIAVFTQAMQPSMTLVGGEVAWQA
ncbi:MAG: N-acetylglucosamine-6-phosphate deacetylase [Candidatus Limiplasma sp.]|nr:N-acetylglucosamine-6-phosphate deacetylase [Candidatus Limiplasma sp.]MEA5146002.1 N-acetylglucosamine-6-phosphate deacetylase [Candidatus Limiplasma sp.]